MTRIEERPGTDTARSQPQETGLLEKPTLPHLGLQLLASDFKKINFSCLSHQVCILLWELELTKVAGNQVTKYKLHEGRCFCPSGHGHILTILTSLQHVMGSH